MENLRILCQSCNLRKGTATCRRLGSCFVRAGVLQGPGLYYYGLTTTTAIDGRPVTEYVGGVTGEAVLGPMSFGTSLRA